MHQGFDKLQEKVKQDKLKITLRLRKPQANPEKRTSAVF